MAAVRNTSPRPYANTSPRPYAQHKYQGFDCGGEMKSGSIQQLFWQQLVCPYMVSGRSVAVMRTRGPAPADAEQIVFLDWREWQRKEWQELCVRQLHSCRPLSASGQSRASHPSERCSCVVSIMSITRSFTSFASFISVHARTDHGRGRQLLAVPSGVGPRLRRVQRRREYRHKVQLSLQQQGCVSKRCRNS